MFTDDRRIFTEDILGTSVAEARLLAGDVTREIIGAFFDVYNELGYGFLENVYQRALPVALAARGIRLEREVPMRISFRGESVGDYRADLIVDGRVVVEIKAVERLVSAHEAQLLNYLRATGLRVGLILNFGPQATFRRLMR
ncbi:MAG: GxxExxY protein [Gemmatimonadetes bacterium]|nr:GxxExxY protein [Gemmatimonadota bacterium]